MSSKEFKYRPLLNEEQYAIVVSSLYSFIKNAPSTIEDVVVDLLKESGYKNKNLDLVIELVARHWILEAFFLWARLIEREPKRRRTEQQVKQIFSKRFGDQSYNKALKEIRGASRVILKRFRKQRDVVWRVLKEELGIV